jgi:hypothetical protein
MTFNCQRDTGASVLAVAAMAALARGASAHPLYYPRQMGAPRPGSGQAAPSRRTVRRALCGSSIGDAESIVLPNGT